MADDLLGGVLGGEDEKPEIEAPQALAGAEAFAAAVAAQLSSNDPQVARETVTFLKQQARLLHIQAQHLEDEHALRLAHLAHQSHLLIGQRLGQAIRLSFQVVIALVVIVIGIGIAVMLHDAFSSHSVVIDSFNAPPALASRGVTGTVVASEVLNELTRLQQTTRSSDLAQQKRSLSNGWSNEVRVDVPETGVSLGEISRLLRARFGHDVHIGGSLLESASGGLALTVSGDNLAPKTLSGGAGDLDSLVVGAAQYVYSQFQPALWVHYLVDTGRCPEAVSVIEPLYDTADDQSRASMLTDWATCLPGSTDFEAWERERLQMQKEAIALDPQFWWAYAEEEYGLSTLGEEEEAWRVGQAARRAAGSQLSRLVARGEPALFLPDLFLTHDLQAAVKGLIADAAANGGFGSNPGAANSPYLAIAEAELHDRADAELMVQTLAAHLPRASSTGLARWWPERSATRLKRKRNGGPECALMCTGGSSVKSAGTHRSRRRPAIPTKPMRFSLYRVPHTWWTASASAVTSSTTAATGLARSKRMRKRSRLPRTFPRATTPGASRSRATATSRAPSRSSRPPTSAARTGPTPSKPGATCSRSSVISNKRSTSTTRLSSTRRTGQR